MPSKTDKMAPGMSSLIIGLSMSACVLGVPLREKQGPELAAIEPRPDKDGFDVVVAGPQPNGWSRFPQGTQWANLAWEFKRDDLRHVDVVDVDLFDSSEETIRDHQQKGRTVICYTSAGTLENWRPDADDVPAKALGLGYHGKNVERWFDIRKWELLKDLMNNRLSLAKQKNCDAVEYDNIDCYTNECVKGAGRAELKEYEIQYVKWLGHKAHSKGLAAGFKNAVDILSEMAPLYDFAINESCTHFNECRYYESFKDINKAVFGVEYSASKYKEACAQAQKNGIAMKVADGSSWRNCNINNLK